MTVWNEWVVVVAYISSLVFVTNSIVLLFLSNRFNEVEEKIDSYQEISPAHWATCLEKHFIYKKDDEGVMLAQAISKKLSKKRRRKNDAVQDSIGIE